MDSNTFSTSGWNELEMNLRIARAIVPFKYVWTRARLFTLAGGMIICVAIVFAVRMLSAVSSSASGPTSSNMIVIPVTQSILTLVLFITSLVISQVASGMFKPQDHPLLETLAVQKYSLRQQMSAQLLYIFGLTFISALSICTLFALILHFRSELDVRFVIPGLVSLFTCVIFFGSISLFATLWARNSVVGSLIGAMAVLSSFVLIPPAQQGGITFVWVFDFLDTYRRASEWWLVRLGYFAIGFILLILNRHLLGNTEHLLGLSAPSKLCDRESSHSTGFLTQHLYAWWEGVSQRIEAVISGSSNSTIAQIAYEVWIELRNGRFILVNSILLMLWFVAVITAPNHRGIFYTASAYDFLDRYIGIVSVLYPFLLAWLASDSFTRNRRHQLEESTIAIIKPQKYLLTYILSNIIGALVSIILISVIIFTIALLLSGNFTPSFWLSHFAAYFAIIIYGLGASTIYVTSIAILLSAITPPSLEAITKLGISIGIWAAVIITKQSVLGNLILPGLDMAYRTSMYWLVTAAGLPLIIHNPPGPIVDTGLLPLPLLSAFIQVAVLWLIVSRLYVRQVRTS
jgi:hypothetical protein